MIDIDVKGIVTVTIHKSDGKTYTYQQENAITTEYVAAIYKLLTNGGLNRATSWDFSQTYQTDFSRGMVGVPTTMDNIDLGMPMVKSGESYTFSGSNYDVWIPYVPRQLTVKFIQTTYGNYMDGNEVEVGNRLNYGDEANGREYRYIFGNTRVLFEHDNHANWESPNAPRLSAFTFIADGQTPEDADDNDGTITAPGCSLKGPNVATDTGAANETNRAGKHNTILRLDQGTDTVSTGIGTDGSNHFRIHEVGLITGMSKGATGNGVVDSFKRDPYRIFDRSGGAGGGATVSADRRIPGSYVKPIYIGIVEDNDQSSASQPTAPGFPSGFSTYVDRVQLAGATPTTPLAAERPKFSIDSNDSITIQYRVEITHPFNEYGSFGNSNITTENRYSYRVLSALLKRPVGFPGSNSVDSTATNYLFKSAYSRNTTAVTNTDAITGPETTDIVESNPDIWRQEFSMSEWVAVCKNVSIDGFAVQHTYATTGADVNTVKSVANLTGIFGSGNTNVSNYSRYSASTNAFNREKGATADTSTATTNNVQMAGDNNGNSAGLMMSHNSHADTNRSSFMFPVTNRADSAELFKVAGDVHFIYKGVNAGSKPTWVTYFIDHAGTEQSGFGSQTPANDTDGDLETDRVAAGTAGGNLLACSVPIGHDLIETAALNTNTTQYNDFLDGTSTTWSASGTNNLMMSHYLSITQTNTIANGSINSGETSFANLTDNLPTS